VGFFVKLWLDTETFSEAPLTSGVHKYAEHAEIMLMTWAVDDGPVQCWDSTIEATPPMLMDSLIEASEHWWQNGGMFDRVVLKHAQPYLYSLMPEHKWRDTMVQALAHGLPGSLGALSEIFKLGDNAKDKRGKQLIKMFCKPQNKTSKLRRKNRLTHPAEWEEFKEYAKSDIRAMRELHNKMPKWNYPNNSAELNLWFLDQRMNMAGIYVDTELAEKAVEAVDVAQAGLASDVSEATGGKVAAATQRDVLLAYILREHGVSLPDMRSDTLERRLQDPSLPDAVRELIAIRLQASTSSVSKYKRLIKGVSSDGYLRGLTQFNGAARTGRDAHRLFQPGNMMRPTISQSDIETGIDAIKAGCADLITDNVMELTSNTMRSVIIPPPGYKIVVSDLANIEGRVAAWVAGEHWKLQAFRDYDAGTGPDLYVKAYSEAFRVGLAEVTKKLRQIGKVMELMLAYGGGVGAFLTGAATYGIDLDELARTGRDAIPDSVWAEADNFWNWSVDTKRNTYGLSHDTFCVCDSIKRMWRASNSAISSVWAKLEGAARNAINEPGENFKVGHVTFRRDGNWLRCILPSGRALCYPSPRVNDEGQISYMGQNQYTRQWSRLTTYGGKLLENICQAMARDVMFYNMSRIEEERYSIRVRIHDELITYAPDGLLYGPKHLSKLLAIVPAWAPGLPLAAAGFEGYRYRKD
jgi:DNA polymerase bacteriophage-type